MSTRDKTTVDADAKGPGVSRPTGSTAVHDREGVATDPRDLVRFSIPEFEYRPFGGAPDPAVAALRLDSAPAASRGAHAGEHDHA